VIARLHPARHGTAFYLFFGVALVTGIGLLDYLTGYELSFSVFYVIPIALVTWYTTRGYGLLAAAVCAAVWFLADRGQAYSNPFFPYWNALIRLSFFVIIAVLISAVRAAAERERDLSRVDSLTGAANSRYFYELAQREIDRFSRYGRDFTLAYVDLDNFKEVNDTLGHSMGDEVLRTVVAAGRSHLRKADLVARLGGDEFALLLPETPPEAARVAVSQLRSKLLEAMNQRGWPVTFSIGVLTCRTSPGTTDNLVRMADDLMYSVKHAGKDAVTYSTFDA